MDEQEQMIAPEQMISPRRENSDLMQWVLEGKDIVTNLKNFLEGLAPTIQKGKLVLVQVSEPLMNSEGVSVTLMMMHAANKQAIMSELDDLDIREIVGDFNDDYIDVMAVNTNRRNNCWAVKPAMRSLIVTTIISHLRSALLMARNAGFRKAVNTMESVNRSIIDQPQHRTSFFGSKRS
jgi:hypothetical protein